MPQQIQQNARTDASRLTADDDNASRGPLIEWHLIMVNWYISGIIVRILLAETYFREELCIASDDFVAEVPRSTTRGVYEEAVAALMTDRER